MYLEKPLGTNRIWFYHPKGVTGVKLILKLNHIWANAPIPSIGDYTCFPFTEFEDGWYYADCYLSQAGDWIGHIFQEDEYHEDTSDTISLCPVHISVK